jgi:hypothetical protein
VPAVAIITIDRDEAERRIFESKALGIRRFRTLTVLVGGARHFAAMV